MKFRFLGGLMAAALLAAAPAWAHKPLAVGINETSPENPIFIAEPDVSQVVYHEATEDFPALWLSFDGVEGVPVLIQAGMPEIVRFMNQRPVLALLHPDLPEADLPFEVPEGFGAWVFPTAGETPTIFSEPFTGTRSWQFEPHDVTMPASGQYFLVGFLPDLAPGKFWVTVGTREVFGLQDILELPRITTEVREFHEIPRFGGLVFIVPMIMVIIGLFIQVVFRVF